MAPSMIQVVGFHSKILPLLPDMFQLFIPAQGLPHIKRILPRFSTGGIVVIIVYYAPKDAISVGRTPSAIMLGLKDKVEALHTLDLGTSQRPSCSLPGRKDLRTMPSALRIHALKPWSGFEQGLIFYVVEQL